MRPGCLFALPITVLCVAAVTAQAPTRELTLTPENVHWS